MDVEADYKPSSFTNLGDAIDRSGDPTRWL
jgi:hypothetical protein